VAALERATDLSVVERYVDGEPAGALTDLARC
jgi:hypothetical protein